MVRMCASVDVVSFVTVAGLRSNKSLVGVQFVEKEEQLYCADDYYNVFAPRCYNCQVQSPNL